MHRKVQEDVQIWFWGMIFMDEKSWTYNVITTTCTTKNRIVGSLLLRKVLAETGPLIVWCQTAISPKIQVTHLVPSLKLTAKALRIGRTCSRRK